MLSMGPIYLAALVVTGIAAVFDVRTGHVPNRLTLGALAAALAAHAGAGALHGGARGAFSSFGASLLGAVVCAALPVALFYARAMGGGDVKLFAAVGALLGAPRGFDAEAWSFVAAMVIAPAYLAYKGTLLRTCANTAALVANPFRDKANRRPLPPELMTWFRLAPAIFVGTAISALSQGVSP
jgi:prepilin peptidase CpaA